MRINKLDTDSMDNLMTLVRHMNVPPEYIINYLLKNTNSSMELLKLKYDKENTEKGADFLTKN